MSASIKILLTLLVFLLPIQSLADQRLEDLQKQDRAYGGYIEFLEKRAEQLDKDIKYWEHQLTGYRQWVWSRWSGLREWIEDGIQRDKQNLDIVKKNLDRATKDRKKLLREIVDIESGVPDEKRLEGSWEFGRKTGPKELKLDKSQAIGTVTLTLKKGDHGYIIDGPYRHANESFWKLEGNTLSFMHKDGPITTSFSPTDVYWKNWEGDYRPVREPKISGVVHYLKRK